MQCNAIQLSYFQSGLKADSHRKLFKGKIRSRLTDFNLNEFMILATTNLQPDIEKLASKITHKIALPPLSVTPGLSTRN